MSVPIRLGVIGAGGAARRLHWPVLQKMSRQIRVAGVSSRSPEKAEEFAAMVGGARVYPHYHEILADPAIDAILTAVPIESNARVMIDAVAAGKHVIAEKPIAATPAEGLQVLQACSGASSVVMIGENFRYRRDLLKARELVDSGAIGEVFAFDLNVHVDLDAEIRRVWTERPWRREPAHPGGFLLDAGVHPVSFLRDLLGDVCEVYAQTLDRHPIIGGPDTLLMQMKFDHGISGQYLACYTAKCNRESLLDLTVYGSRATLEVRPGKVEYGHGPATGASFRVPKSDRGYESQWRNFCDAIRGSARVVSTPEKAFGDLLVIDAALRSARESKPVSLAPSSP